MFVPGLVSITFRKLSPEAIIELVLEAELKAIEWGGDVHVPHGDIQRARQVGELTRKSGLEIAAYGSYYRLCESEPELKFETVLDTAVALGAPTIRVWAGSKGSSQADETYRRQVVEQARNIAELAQEKSITVSFEYHADTLTDTNESAQNLIKQINHPNVHLYWQPVNGATVQYNIEGASMVKRFLTNIHVFHWPTTPRDRRPLAEGVDRWQSYLEAIGNDGNKHYALIEFVKDDSPQQFLEDSKALLQIIS